jgi:hypothetical protein
LILQPGPAALTGFRELRKIIERVGKRGYAGDGKLA